MGGRVQHWGESIVCQLHFGSAHRTEKKKLLLKIAQTLETCLIASGKI